jgi:hypothetical protein
VCVVSGDSFPPFFLLIIMKRSSPTFSRKKTYVSSVCSKCFIYIKHKLQVFLSGRCYIYMHIASVCFKFFWCFIRLLQVFHLDIFF